MSDNESEKAASTNMKAMLENMFKEFKTDMLSSVEVMIENRINEGEEEEEREVEENSCEKALDVDALMNNVMAGNIDTNDTDQASTSLDALLDEFNPEKAQGPPINEKLAVLINSLLKDGLTKEQLNMKKDYLQPENCPTLDTPKVNNMLWAQLKQEPRNLDSGLQKGQGHLMSAIYALLNVCNQMMTKSDNNEPLTTLTHAVVLLMSANRQFNLSRRELLRPHLNKNYQALCNPSAPITKYLFGDDLNKQVDELTKANRIGQRVNGKPKYHPYIRNTFRGRFKHGYSGRGRSANTTGRGAFLASSRGLAPRRQMK